MEFYLLNTEKEFRNFLFEKGDRLTWVSKHVLNDERVNYSDVEIVEVSSFFLQLFKNDSITEENYWTFYTYLSEAYLREYGGIYKYSKNEIDDIYKKTCIIYTKGPTAFMSSEFITKIFELENPNYYRIRIDELTEITRKNNSYFEEVKKRNNLK